MNAYDINTQTNEVIVRDLSSAEIEHRETLQDKVDANAQAAADAAAAAASGRAKLAALGLTDDEINALLGG